MSDPVEMRPAEVLAASDVLVTCGDDVFGAAPSSEPAVPDIPVDDVDLARGLIAFEEARAAFDRRYAEGLRAAGGRVAGFALDTLATDGSILPVALPAAARSAPGRRR